MTIDEPTPEDMAVSLEHLYHGLKGASRGDMITVRTAILEASLRRAIHAEAELRRVQPKASGYEAVHE